MGARIAALAEADSELLVVHRIGRDTRRLEYDFPGFAALADDLRATRAGAGGGWPG